MTHVRDSGSGVRPRGSSKAHAIASASVPGSCGEFVQGILDGHNFLISCPIDMYSTATVTIVNGRGRVYGAPEAPKARRTVELTLARFQRSDVDVCLRLENPLPSGKGMASSTADIAASAAATAKALDECAAMNPSDITRLALEIEPTDSVSYPGITMFDHKRGNLIKMLGNIPPMRIAVLDFGGTVDTVAFNRTNRNPILNRNQSVFLEAISLIESGIKDRNPRDIGAGAVLSAIANQEVLFKPQLDDVLRLAEDVGAVGVNVAHSGTVIGMLFDDDVALMQDAVSQSWRKLSGIKRIYNRRVVNGGRRSTYDEPRAVPLNGFVSTFRRSRSFIVAFFAFLGGLERLPITDGVPMNLQKCPNSRQRATSTCCDKDL